MFSKWLKKRDIFGYQISLNFDAKNSEVATSFGGLLSIQSIVYRVIVYGFLLMKLKQMYYYADDSVVSVESQVKYKDLDP